VLRLYLHHGDILIQQGVDLQKYYEVFTHPQLMFSFFGGVGFGGVRWS
jgi:hypothetical protein